jgi:ABC-2 type transport system ATP-binding protein/lipopolysaccharide transport system ATP-binding protein
VTNPVEAVHLEAVSVRYRVPSERVRTFKEYFIRRLKGEVQMRTFWALHDVALNVYPGEVFGLVGVNGAGKSTLLKVVARVLRPTKGRVIVRGRVAPLLELGAGFHPELTGKENIFLNGALLGFSNHEMREKYDRIVEFAELGEFINAPIRTYSSAFQQKCAARIEAFRLHGAAILLVSHSMDSIQAMCQRAAWLDHGALKAIGEPAQVIRAYRERGS